MIKRGAGLISYNDLAILVLPLLFLLILLPAHSQSTCDSLVVLKKKVYGFKPSDLSDSLKNLKSDELDIFWRVAKNNPKEAAICLQQLIESETMDSYFCFDASSLLLGLDTSMAYRLTAINGLKKCELKDLQLSPYLQICFYLGYKGHDIGDLTIKLISVPNARIFLSNHFLTLHAIDASIFLFNIMPTELAEKTLFQAVLGSNSVARHNAAVVLNLAATDRGDSLLNFMIKNKQLGDSTVKFIKKDRKAFVVNLKGTLDRAKVLEALNDVPYNFEKEFFGFSGSEQLIGSACKQLGKEDIEAIRKARKKSTYSLSDEALHEYFALTKILMTVRAKKSD